MERHGSNRERKLKSRGDQREEKKHDARANRHRDRALAQTKPKEEEEEEDDEIRLGLSTFGFMLNETSGRANTRRPTEATALVPEEQATIALPPKLNDGYGTYTVRIARVSLGHMFHRQIMCEHDSLVRMIASAVDFHNARYDTDYDVDEVEVVPC